MSITELQLSKLIKHYLVREFKEHGIHNMCIKEFLPLCATLLYPYINYDIFEEGKGYSIIPLIDSIKKFTKKVRGLSNYTFEGLRQYFQKEWLPALTYEKQVSLLNCISLIDKVEDDGYFSIKGNEKVYENYLHGITLLDISNNYGNEMYEINTDDENIRPEENTPTDDSHEEIASLTPLKEFLLTNFPLNKYPKGLSQYDYFWQYKLNSSQYEDLKNIINDLNLAQHLKLLKKEISGYGTVALSVALYISEWYKRESPSLDGDRCLETIGLTSAKSSNIWKEAKLSEELLHQDEKGNQMRQTAMCALGGLPLMYVYNSDRFNQFVNGLFILKNESEDIGDEDIESIVDCFDDRNKVFKRSLKSGSCKEYLIQLVDYLESGRTEDLPFAESDIKNTPFSDFIRILQEGYDEAFSSKFFQKEIRIWTYDYMEDGDDSNLIESEFYVHIGFLKSKNVITARELSKLRITLPQGASMFDARLKITLRDGSSTTTDEKRTYHKIGNHCDDFCGAFGSSLATSIDFYNTKDIALLIECGDYCKEIPLYTIPSYLELYATDNGFLWTTKTDNTARKVLFYDKSIYTPQNGEYLNILTKSYKESDWGWVYLTEPINLVDSTGVVKTIGLGKTELIMVDFKVKSLRKAIELSKDGCVECVIRDDDLIEIPLLYFDDNKRPMLSCDGLRGNSLLENYKIEFKKISDHNYSEWTTNNVPSQGFLSIRISCRDDRKKKKPRKLDVYFIPGTYPIVKRNLDNNYIYIKGENICVLDESLRKNLKQTDDEFNYKFQDSCDNLQLSSIRFRIGDDDNHIILKVYRAFNWTQILNNGKMIKNITNDGSEKPPVALILQGNKLVKVVNEEGYKIYSPCFQRYLDYFGDPRNLSFVKQGKSLSGFYIDESSQPFLYCVYISSFDDNGKIRKIVKKKDDRGNEYILLNVSEDYINEYVLCYWSGEQKDNPIRIEPAKQSERLYCFNIPSPLQRKAVVFQSLSDCSPNLYFRPFYADENWWWNNYVQRYDSVSIDYIIKCYQLAVEHNVYFGIFPAIRNLQKREVFTEFIRIFAKQKNYHLSDKDKDALVRLAKELAMDWFFVNRSSLYNDLNVEEKGKTKCFMRGLLLHSPIVHNERAFSQKFIDLCFLATNSAFDQRDGKLPRKFLKALDQFKDYDGRENTQNRIDLLNRLVSTDVNIFQEICNILNI